MSNFCALDETLSEQGEVLDNALLLVSGERLGRPTPRDIPNTVIIKSAHAMSDARLCFHGIRGSASVAPTTDFSSELASNSG